MNISEFLADLRDQDDNVIISKTMSMITSLGYLRSIVDKIDLSDHEKTAILLLKSTIRAYSDLKDKNSNFAPRWSKMKYGCAVYSPPNGWVDITTGKIIKNGNVYD